MRMKTKRSIRSIPAKTSIVLSALFLPSGCGSDKETIQNIGSDTLLTIAQALPIRIRPIVTAMGLAMFAMIVQIRRMFWEAARP